MTKALTDDLPLSPKTRKRLAAAAKSAERSADEVAAAVLDAAFEADEHDQELTRQAIGEAEAGGPFASNEDVLKWLKSWGTENELPAPEATIRF